MGDMTVGEEQPEIHSKGKLGINSRHGLRQLDTISVMTPKLEFPKITFWNYSEPSVKSKGQPIGAIQIWDLDLVCQDIPIMVRM